MTAIARVAHRAADWACPSCGSDETEINTLEAWCFDCDWHLDHASDPEAFEKLRSVEEERRAERMDRSELWMVREALGFSRQELASILDIREDTLRRWEHGRDLIPFRVREQVETLEAHTAQAVAELVAALQDSPDPTVGLYARNEDMHAARPDTSHLPARWWRQVVYRACEQVPGVKIITAD